MKSITKIILLSIVLLSITTCATIGDYKVRKDSGCPNCKKFEDMGYQKVWIVTNYDKLSPDDFKAYVKKIAAFFHYTRIRYFWMKMLGGERILREAVIYYE